jgi:hypothetical protein
MSGASPLCASIGKLTERLYIIAVIIEEIICWELLRCDLVDCYGYLGEPAALRREG